MKDDKFIKKANRNLLVKNNAAALLLSAIVLEVK